jgi:DNA polymerase-3 subunit epsilon
MFSIIDIETTGNFYPKGKIIEIAIIVFDGFEIIGTYTSLINPDCFIPYYITKLTGINNQMVISAPRFFEIAKKIDQITSNCIFVAHNVNFDYSFIQEEFKRLGDVYQRKTFCTLRMSRKYLPEHKSYSLGKLCRDLNINIINRHRALGDAMATVELLKLILKQKSMKDAKQNSNQLRLF